MPSERKDADTTRAADGGGTYGSALIEDGIGLFTNGLAAFPSAMVISTLVFMLETQMTLPDAKFYFLMGLFLLLVPFYTVGMLCFPAGESSHDAEGGEEAGEEAGNQTGGGAYEFSIKMRGGELSPKTRTCMQAMAPFMGKTSASFYNFAAGYLFGYWSNLNMIRGTANSTMATFYYFAIAFFCFVFSVFYVQSCGWQSGLSSSALGVIGGMVWSQMIADKIPANATPSSASNTSGLDGNTTQCSGSKTDDMVCNAFRQ